jgi:ubiquinone/menaquinone biosynthesis C-methylase UbiE
MNPVTKRRMNYDEVAPHFERRYEETQYPGTEAALQEHIADLPGLSVLEVGCGTGYWLSILLERGLRVEGLDSSRGMLERASQRAGDARLVLGSAEALPYPVGTFDRICCINAFHHFGDKQRFLTEAARVLRPGGRLLTVGLDPHAGLDRWYIYDYFDGTRELDAERYPAGAEIRAGMAAAGFTQCDTFEVERLEVQRSAREALDAGLLDKRATSQLGILTDREYSEGIERVLRDTALAEARSEKLWLNADLRLYGTLGALPA